MGSQDPGDGMDATPSDMTSKADALILCCHRPATEKTKYFRKWGEDFACRIEKRGFQLLLDRGADVNERSSVDYVGCGVEGGKAGDCGANDEGRGGCEFPG